MDIITPVDMRSAQRLHNSRNGNPRYAIDTDRGRFVTAPDASVNYDVDNWFGAHRVNGNRHRVTIMLDRSNRIIDIAPADAFTVVG